MTDSVGFQFRERKGEDEFTNNIPRSAMQLTPPVDTILLEIALVAVLLNKVATETANAARAKNSVGKM